MGSAILDLWSSCDIYELSPLSSVISSSKSRYISDKHSADLVYMNKQKQCVHWSLSVAVLVHSLSVCSFHTCPNDLHPEGKCTRVRVQQKNYNAYRKSYILLPVVQLLSDESLTHLIFLYLQLLIKQTSRKSTENKEPQENLRLASTWTLDQLHDNVMSLKSHQVYPLKGWY